MDNMDYHRPVMLLEVLKGLNLHADGIYIDGTLGGAGHSYQILKRTSPNGKLIAFDKDTEAIKYSERKLKEFEGRFTLIHADFKDAKAELNKLGVTQIDGVLLDLGISSHQIDIAERGFSYVKDAPLDMRMNQEQILTAYDVTNNYSHGELARILRDYGEEPFAGKIASAIINARPIKTTLQLADLVKRSVPVSYAAAVGHPAKKTFQAIRIEVNKELSGLDKAIEDFITLLKPKGRIAVITFHSLEDRIVKTAFNYHASGCVCDKKSPVCTCGHVPQIIPINKKPVTPTDSEIKSNPRAASAKLRISEKL